MNITRRALLIGSGLAAVARRSPAQMAHMPPMAPAPPLVDPGKLAAFVDPLPSPSLAVAAGKRPSPGKKSHMVPYYRIPMQQAYLPIHRDIPPTRFWTYGGTMPGSTIEARSGEEILIEWPNQLPSKHFLPIDHNIMGAEAGQPEVRTVVHVHGARVPPASDGYPTDWYVPGKSGTYRYPNEQEAAMLWYHDHAMGINRLNICAGLAGLYIVRDSVEDALHLPKGAFEIPLV
jgi:spore coat protein A